MIADEGLAKRIRRDDGGRSIAAWAALFVGAQILFLATSWLTGSRDRDTLLLLSCLLVAGGVASVLIFTVIRPAMLRRHYGPGTRLAAEFGPDFVAFTTGSTRQIIRTSQIDRVVVDRSVIRIRGNGHFAERIVIPLELVPPHVALGLRQRFDDERSRRWV
ncbi:hypothetical protein [Gordonia aurantiaca]|uniref:hypothetical protein n=1 Tax=Gordonia sp. B21 TaxID=3151852 RepID=UPI003266C8F1